MYIDPNRYGITGETPLVEHPGGYSRVNVSFISC